MNYSYSLLLPAMLVVLLFVGSVSAPALPSIPSPPYFPKSPQEDIVKVEAYIEHDVILGYILHLTVTFAAPTPPAGQAIHILITGPAGNPPIETVIGWFVDNDPATNTRTLGQTLPPELLPPLNIAVYAWVGEIPNTDRAPNGGFYQITSLSATAPNQFYDPDGPVGGVVMPTNRLEILTPFLALAGLIVAVSAVVLVKKRRD